MLVMTDERLLRFGCNLRMKDEVLAGNLTRGKEPRPYGRAD